MNDDYIYECLDLMQAVTPERLRELAELLRKEHGTRAEGSTARETLLHYLGNMVVVATAGTAHAIRAERKSDYESLMRQFGEVHDLLVKCNLQIYPQIKNAILLVDNPQMDK